ncbi:glycoside hydrolase family 18 protein [Hydnomerulius pinastri MD-312]|nr:glycoside hydrolase family 18 protein [Hydnomerulius pinastri MD-312]
MVIASAFSCALLHLATLVGVLLTLQVRGSVAVPLASTGVNASLSLDQGVALERRTTPAAPHFVIYSDQWVSGENGPPAVSAIQGYNVFTLSFWLISGPADQALEWTTLSSSTRSSIKSSYAAAGIKLIVSAFGSTDAPTSTGADPTTTANNLAAFVIQYGLDGVDVDYEDFNAMNAMNGSAETWLATFTKALRAKLPAGQYIITHAPVAPWFSPIYTSGAYLKVHQTVGSLIDWYNVQFYNQGSSEYTTCTGLLTTSSSTWPNTAVFQISAAGVTLNKIVIGKPATSGDASNGYMSTSTLASCLGTAVGKGWNAGVMVWEYPDAAAAWIKSVRAVAFPE